jgi:ribosome-associated protein
MASIRVNRSLEIPESELETTFSTSGGPGGQHANKASTRVELRWNVAESEVLGPRQRARLLDKLRSRIDSRGVLRVVSDEQRSQLRNRVEAERRMGEMVAAALKQEKPRKKTEPSRAAKERRLEQKRRRSETKRSRRTPGEFS